MKPFDEHLFTLKVQKLSDRMQPQTAARLHQADTEQKTIGQGLGTGWLVKRVDAAMGVFREFVPEIEKACRETWLSDHDSITPEFIRGVLVPHVFTIMAARKGAIHGDLELLARRVGLGTELTPVLNHLVHETNRLQNSLATQYEIEALELAKQSDSTKPPQRPRGSAPPPINPVNTSRGLWLDPASKPTEIPHDPPIYFPIDLWPQTNVILLEAQRKFPLRAQTLELCKHVTSEMTPLFCEAVEAGKMKASAVLREGLGGMEDLLHSLLVLNDDGPRTGFGLSHSAYELGQHVRKSDEWLGLAREIDQVKPRPQVAETKSKTWIKLERRGDFIVLAGPSADTATQIRYDYDLLKWNVRQIDQWVSQRKQGEKQPTLEEAKTAFAGTILVGDTDRVPYLTDRELEDLLAHPKTPSSFAQEILVKRWGFTAATVKTYLRRRPHRKRPRG
jgi:hypothetical protein